MIQSNKIWVSALLVWLISGLALCLSFAQEQLSIWVNSKPGAWLDIPAKYLTWFGDGWMIVACCLILFLFDKKFAWFLLLSYLVSSGLTQLLKHTVFSDFHRPMYYLSNNPIIHQIQGVELNYHHSFPSGHTTAAFAFFMGIALWKRSTQLTIILLAISILIGLTRVYLLQHFFMDVVGGSFVGSAVAFACYYLISIKGPFWPFKFNTNA